MNNFYKILIFILSLAIIFGVGIFIINKGAARDLLANDEIKIIDLKLEKIKKSLVLNNKSYLDDLADREAFLGIGDGLPKAAVGDIKIAAARTSGPNGSKDEFVKLFNATGKDIDLRDWSLKKITKSGNEYNLVSNRSFEGVIKAGGFFLIAHSDYRGEEKADLFYSSSNNLSASGNIVVLYDNFGRIINKVEYKKTLNHEIIF